MDCELEVMKNEAFILRTAAGQWWFTATAKRSAAAAGSLTSTKRSAFTHVDSLELVIQADQLDK
jgi:hypothetical protein